jgi:hypothetical protein
MTGSPKSHSRTIIFRQRNPSTGWQVLEAEILRQLGQEAEDDDDYYGDGQVGKQQDELLEPAAQFANKQFQGFHLNSLLPTSSKQKEGTGILEFHGSRIS